MTKNAAVNFGCHCHCFHYFSAIIILSKIVAVIAKVDCRVFCHINSLGDKISNTAAPIQPNPFWFWEKYHCFFMIFPRILELLVFSPLKVLKSRSAEENVRNDHIYIQFMKQHMT